MAAGAIGAASPSPGGSQGWRANALPRAWLTHDAQQATPEDALHLLASGEIDPRQTTLVETSPPVLAAPPAGSANTVTFIERSPERIRLTVDAAAAGLLVLSETYDPGWNAFVNGVKVEILRANYLFRAIPVPAGESEIEFRIEPVETRIGLAISGLTMLIVLPVFILAIRRRRPFGEQPYG